MQIGLGGITLPLSDLTDFHPADHYLRRYLNFCGKVRHRREWPTSHEDLTRLSVPLPEAHAVRVSAPSPPAPNQMEHFANDVLGIWRKPCPEAGVYTSKVNIVEPNFHQSFYGSNYERLYQLKQSYDASGLFYAPTGVGSEDWTVKNHDGLPDQNGLSRLV